MKWKINKEGQLSEVSDEICRNIDEKVILFHGSMGAGKTTLIKYICVYLGAAEPVASPTFSIVNEYRNQEGEPIYHFDFYRIEDEEEAYDFGYEEYFFSGHLCLVEWPEKIRNLLPQTFGLIEIDEKDGWREISFSPSEQVLP